ncbi:MAG: transglutaminase domain-containing protein, partial [Planctomycetota bacterium]
GLTILMVDACRSVGIPARAAGVQQWHDDRGNHTWVEVWDGARWRFCGADEHDPAGLDRGWFTADAAKATAGDRAHAVWASSWRRDGGTFPLAWAPDSAQVGAVEVTSRYARATADAELEMLGDDGAALGEEAAGRLVQELWSERRVALAEELRAEDESDAFVVGEHTLRVKERRFGDAPEGARSLWISMHGGGGAPPELNDRQWDNQIRLYEPAEGFYVAPRAPTNTWNLWHQAHIDPLFDRLITSYVTRHGVDPNRVYLMGYSAGGDGVYQLAPRLADRFAAAAMMAGHPNETRPDGLRNLPFRLFMGGDDAAYDRNKKAADWKAELARLRDADPSGYPHEVTIYPGKGHWMDGEDREALPWMAERARDPWPSKVVWLQDDVRRTRFYWLELVEPGDGADRARVVAEVVGQTIAVGAEGLDRIALRLRDTLIDLDREIVVTFGGAEVFRGTVPRTRAAIEASLEGRADPWSAATARLVVERP